MGTTKIIAQLYLCAAQCDYCRKQCLEEKDAEHLQRCIMLNNECREICRLSGSLLEVNSENAAKFLKLCGEICKICGEECKKHKHDHCRKCAEECFKCAEFCEQYQQEDKVENTRG